MWYNAMKMGRKSMVPVRTRSETRRRRALASIAPVSEPSRDLFYGWVILCLSIAGLVASSPGQTFGVSIFNEAMRRDLGIGHGALAAAYTLGTLVGAIPIAFIGRLMDRIGLRQTMLIVVSLFSAACLVTSLIGNWASLVLAFTLLRMLGPGALSLVSGSMLSFWFDRRLGMVEGVRQVGMAAAMAGIPIASVWLESNWGWRAAYRLFGITILVFLFPAVAIWCRNRPEDVGQRIDGTNSLPTDSGPASDGLAIPNFTLREALGTASFWIVAGGTALFGLIHTALFFCIVPILHERQLSTIDVTLMLTTLAACLAVMQVVAGILADRLPASSVLAAGSVLLSLGVAMLFWASSRFAVIFAGALLGISQATFFAAVHPLWARYYGRQHLGAIRGTLMTFNVAASSLGPLFVGVARDLTGNFDAPIAVFAVLPVPLALLCLAVKPPVHGASLCRTQATDVCESSIAGRHQAGCCRDVPIR